MRFGELINRCLEQLCDPNNDNSAAAAANIWNVRAQRGRCKTHETRTLPPRLQIDEHATKIQSYFWGEPNIGKLLKRDNFNRERNYLNRSPRWE